MGSGKGSADRFVIEEESAVLFSGERSACDGTVSMSWSFSIRQVSTGYHNLWGRSSS